MKGSRETPFCLISHEKSFCFAITSAALSPVLKRVLPLLRVSEAHLKDIPTFEKTELHCWPDSFLQTQESLLSQSHRFFPL